MVVCGSLLAYRFYEFLNTCTTYPNFKPAQRNLPTSYSSPDSIIYIKIVLFALLGILLIVSVTAFPAANKTVFFGSIAVAIICIAIAIKYIQIIIGRKRK